MMAANNLAFMLTSFGWRGNAGNQGEPHAGRKVPVEQGLGSDQPAEIPSLEPDVELANVHRARRPPNALPAALTVSEVADILGAPEVPFTSLELPALAGPRAAEFIPSHVAPVPQLPICRAHYVAADPFFL